MKIKKLLFTLCLLVAVALSIRSFREPDLWWQIRTGQWIIEHHQVPKSDVFSFTMNGTEWINIKWGFEVIAAFLAGSLGPESVFLLQALVNCLLLFFLLKLSLLYYRKRGFEHPYGQKTFLLAGIISFLLVMVGTEYRMIGRPEMISHLMTILFLYLLEKDKYQPSRNLFLLIPLQLLWANLHEAFGIGIVLLCIYTASAWVEKLLIKTDYTQLKRLILATICSTAAVALNPNGVKLLLRPFNIMSQVYSNKYTTELLDFTTSEWWKKEAFIGLAVSLISIISILSTKKNVKKNEGYFFRIITWFNNPYLLTLLAFLYLGLSAYRNLAFLSLISFPVLHISLFSWMQKRFSKLNLFEQFAIPLSVLLPVIFYVGIVTDYYYKFTNSRDRFGLEVLSINNPVGAAGFIQENNLGNKKCFSDYLTSSYLLWKLQPDFKTYIDLRDLDIFPPAFFTDFLRDANSPVDFHLLDSIQKFDYAVIFRPQFEQLHAYLYNDSIYALKYVDAVAAIYEKTDLFTREDIFTPCKPVKAGTFATVVNKVLNPLYHPFDYSTVENDYIAGNYYLTVGRFDLVRQRAAALLQNMRTAYKGNELIAQVYFRSSIHETDDSVKNVLLSSAEDAYRESLRDNKNYAPSLLGLGSVHFAGKNYTAAIRDFTECLDEDKDNYQAHLSIAQCYRELMNISTTRKEEYRRELLRHFLKANSLSPGNPMIEANIGFVYFQMNDCDHATRYLSRVSGEKSLNAEDQLAVQNCLRQCGY